MKEWHVRVPGTSDMPGKQLTCHMKGKFLIFPTTRMRKSNFHRELQTKACERSSWMSSISRFDPMMKTTTATANLLFLEV
jgi:hypothetical protein